MNLPPENKAQTSVLLSSEGFVEALMSCIFEEGQRLEGGYMALVPEQLKARFMALVIEQQALYATQIKTLQNQLAETQAALDWAKADLNYMPHKYGF